MAVETKSDLKQETLEKLHDLVQVNMDSQKGLVDAAGGTEDLTVANLFTEIAQQRCDCADELKKFINFNGESVRDDEGSWLGAFHRVWIGFRTAINGGDAYVILCEAEKGEDFIKQGYEEAIKDTAGSAMNDVLLKQYSLVKEGHDRIRNLRDAYAKLR